MEIKGCFRSKNSIVAYEEHYSGRITELGYAFYLFEGNGTVKRYLSGEAQPLDASHEAWEKSVGKVLVNNGFKYEFEIYAKMTKRTTHFSMKIIDSNNIEITNLRTGETMEYEKVSDL